MFGKQFNDLGVQLASNSTAASGFQTFEGFPKSSRLLVPADFRFKAFKCLRSENFVLYLNTRGTGRVGISISKKVLRRAVARNRVRRLLREVFRKNKNIFNGLDVNFSGTAHLSQVWAQLDFNQVEREIREIPLPKEGMKGAL